MAKYLMLSPDPSHRWELPPETDMEDLRTRLHKALAGPGVVEGVQLIQVVVEGLQIPLHLDRSRLWLFALVDLPDTPAARPIMGPAGPNIMGDVLNEPH